MMIIIIKMRFGVAGPVPAEPQTFREDTYYFIITNQAAAIFPIADQIKKLFCQTDKRQLKQRQHFIRFQITCFVPCLRVYTSSTVST